MNTHIFLIAALFLTTAFANADQIVAMKDGSQVRGELVSVVNGIYTVQTQTMGRVNVSAGNVVSINNAEATQASPASLNTPAPRSSEKTADIDQQFQQTQQLLLSNPQALADIQEIAKDPEIMKMLSDPALIQSATQHDVNGIQKNPTTQELLKNPKMQALLEKLLAGAKK